MDGKTFELAVVDLLQVLGYDDVQRIGGLDEGAGILAVEAGEQIAVQARRCSLAVGVGAIRQLLDGMNRHGCSRGLAITNGVFTEQAIEYASASGVELWDRTVLGELVEAQPPREDRARRSAAA